MKRTNLLGKAISPLFILMLVVSYSCDNDDGSANILDNTSWYLTSYEDSEGNFRPVVYPDDCDDNSCYTLRFMDGSVSGTLDDFNPRYKTFHLGKYIANSDNRFEYVDLPPTETGGPALYSENGFIYISNIDKVNTYNIDENTLKLSTSEGLL